MDRQRALHERYEAAEEEARSAMEHYLADHAHLFKREEYKKNLSTVAAACRRADAARNAWLAAQGQAYTGQGAGEAWCELGGHPVSTKSLDGCRNREEA